jgi:hypothetical protein
MRKKLKVFFKGFFKLLTVEMQYLDSETGRMERDIINAPLKDDISRSFLYSSIYT